MFQSAPLLEQATVRMMDPNLCRFSKSHQLFKDLKDAAPGPMPWTSALHAAFPGDIDGQDPKSQREIDQLPPEEAKR